MSSTSIVCLVLGGVVAANIVATARVMQTEFYSTKQRGLQNALIWLLPILGVAIVLAVRAHDRMSSPQVTIRSDDDSTWVPGIGPTSDRSHPTETFGDLGHDGHGSDGGGHRS